jgi:hypothetical protein
MSFDPYHKWLGIRPEEQPADHYRLLAIARFESDPDVIETAADRQMGHLRTFQTGPHSALSQKLLNELAAARLCLLCPDKKAAYDAELRRRFDAAHPVRAVLPVAVMVSHRQVPAPIAEPAPLFVADSRPKRWATPQAVSLSSRSLAWLIFAAVALPVIAGIGYLVIAKVSADRKLGKRNATPVPIAPHLNVKHPQQTTGSAETGQNRTKPEPTPLSTPPKRENLVDRGGNKKSDEEIERRPEAVDVPRGRYVRIELPRKGTLTLAEVEVYSGGRNIARLGKATQKNTSWGGDAARAIDGNKNGVYGVGGQTHTEENTLDPWWEVDLGGMHSLERIVVYNRTNNNCGKRLDGFNLRVLDAARDLVVERIGISAPESSAEFDLKIGKDSRPSLEPALPPANQAVVRGKPVDLLNLIDIKRDAIVIADNWGKGARLVTPKGETTWVEVPHALPEEYQVNAVVEPDRDSAGIVLGVVIGDRQTLVGINVLGGTATGLALVDDKSFEATPTKTGDRYLQTGRPNTITFVVRKNRVLAICNGDVAVDWRDDMTRLSLHPVFRDKVRNPRHLFIGAWLSTVKLTKFELAPLINAKSDAPATASVPAVASSDVTPKEAAKPAETSISGLDDPEFQQWMKWVQALPAKEQVGAVINRLRKLNPGSIGKISHRIEHDKVVEFSLDSTGVQNISPVRALSGLTNLTYRGLTSLTPHRGRKVKKLLSDLSPLAGMHLTRLECQSPDLTDLSPLKGMKLEHLDCSGSGVSDLSPLTGMPLSTLNISGSKVVDLSPLPRASLTTLICGHTKISDLAPLKGIPLEELNISMTSVRDLSPLKGMPLTKLDVAVNPPPDLNPIKGLPLTEIRCNLWQEQDIQLLRSMKTLVTINNKPAETALNEAVQAMKAFKARQRQ